MKTAIKSMIMGTICFAITISILFISGYGITKATTFSSMIGFCVGCFATACICKQVYFKADKENEAK